MKQSTIIISLVLMLVAGASCKKFLDAKSVQNLSTPSTLADLEAILNNVATNRASYMLNGFSDEYYYIYADWLSRSLLQKDGYIWAADLNDYNDWSVLYNTAFNANTVLFNLGLVPANSETARWNEIKGQALFFRAIAFFRAVLIYAPQYDKTTAANTLGIPLRLNADINETSTRATLKETYDQIIADLETAKGLVPATAPLTPKTKTMPVKTTVQGLLARVYLQMGDYTKAYENVQAALATHSALMDFNDAAWVTPADAAVFKPLNPEVILYTQADGSPLSNVRAKVDTVLFKMYDDNDIRKTAYFSINADGSRRFKGSYSGNNVELFCGIATDELYLIRAECNARAGQVNEAMKDVNDLVRTRYKKVNGVSTYVDQTAANSAAAMTIILKERRKELVDREIRWADLKRLNKETSYAVTIKRVLNGQEYLLPPNDPRYAQLVPREVLRIVNLPQTPR